MLDLGATRTMLEAGDAADATLELLETRTPASRRQFEPGHLTASAIVLSPDRDAVLLVRHAKLGRWLQPGGHIEPADASLLAAARRELAEEAAVLVDATVAPALTGIDIHEIPAHGDEPRHLHHDTLFRFVAADGTLGASPEGCPVTWARLDDLDAYDLDAPLRANIARAVRLERTDDD